MTLLLLGAALASGIGVSVWLGDESTAGWAPGWQVALLWATGAAALAWAFRRRGLSYTVPVLLLVFAAGLWRGGIDQQPVHPPANFATAGRVAFEAEMLTEPRPYGATRRLRVHVTEFDTARGAVPADFTVDVLPELLSGDLPEGRSRFNFRYGDRYRITGDFQPAPGEESAGLVRRPAITLLGGGAGNPVRRALAGARAELAGSIRSAIPEPAAGLATAITIGDRTGLDPGTRSAFRRSGAAHLLAISGLHVGVIGAVVLALTVALLGRRRRLYLLAPLSAAWGYAMLAGLSDPTVRAAVMLTAYLGARAAGRQRAALPALGLAALVMLLADPRSISSVSFQFSFAAVGGILLMAPGLTRVIDRLVPQHDGRTPGVAAAMRAVLFILGTGIAATVATFPLVGLAFGVIPVWGVLATALAVPALPFAVGFSALAGAMGLVWSAPADLLGWPAWAASSWMIEVADFFSDLPPGPVETSIWSVPAVLGYYAALLSLLARRRLAGAARNLAPLLRQLPQHAAAARPAPRWLVAAGAIVALLGVAAITAVPDGRLNVTFFKTDRGDLILVETPGGRQMLIDGGLDPNGAVDALGQKLPFWDKSVDIVVLTHPHADHATGLLKVLEQYRTGYILDAPVEYTSDTYSAWLSAATGSPAARITAQPGQRVLLDRGIYADVLNAGPVPWSDNVNDSSVVLRLTYGNVSFLLTGDINAATEQELLRRQSGINPGVDSTVLKVAHQGSRGSSSTEFLAAVAPRVSIVTVGSANPFGHPHKEAIDRIKAVTPDGQVYSTLEDGDITVSTDGKRLWVRAQP